MVLFDAASPAAPLTVRPATGADLPAITRIYNQGIVDRLATLETAERTEAERRAWLAAREERQPVLVAERDGAVVGWGSLNAFNPRPAYRFVADFSVYVERAARGSGVGGALLGALIAEARRLGYHKLILAAFPFNEAGLRLYRRFGFREVGVYREQGVLDGRWVDTIVMELLLDAGPPPPTDLGILRQTGDKLEIADALDAATRAAGALGQWERAARLYGAAAALREAIGAPRPPINERAHQRSLAPVRSALGDAAFAAADAAGRALSLEQAIAEAVALSDELG